MYKVGEGMKKHKVYISISIILLAGLVIFQWIHLCNNTTAKAILDYRYKSFNNDTYYYVLDYVTDLLLKDIPDKDNKTITLLFNNETSPYEEFGIGYLYLRDKVFPMTMYDTEDCCIPLSEKSYWKVQFENEQWDYILLLGKETNIFNETSTHDYTLYKVVDKNNYILKEINSYDLSLYTVYKQFGEESTIFQNLIEMVKYSITEHWNFSSIDLMLNFANDLYIKNENEKAIEYSMFYLENVDFINDTLNSNLGAIYTEKEEYEKAIYHYNVCLRNEACDSLFVNQKISELQQIEE